jgi:hypothetical protein
MTIHYTLVYQHSCKMIIFAITFYHKVIDGNGNGWYYKFIKILSNNDELIEK